MSDELSVIREAILGTSGLGGVLKFNALYNGSFETESGKPDLPAIQEAISHAFPPEQAVIIMTRVAKKLGGSPGTILAAAVRANQAGTPAIATESQAGNNTEGSTTFARYFDADPGQVRDIVCEARRIRLAMGKPVTESTGASGDGAADTSLHAPVTAAEATVEKTMDTALEVAPATPDVRAAASPVSPGPGRAEPCTIPVRPREAADTEPDIDREIRQFAYGQTAHSSMDIIDFIRYLKDKGYSFEESIALEKIYVRIEERKKEDRSAIEKEVEGLFYGARAPPEQDICDLIERLRESGLVFEEMDVRRLVRVAALRRAQDSL
ncbi:MAG: hypothetical protein A4E28_01090 [Methanocella sp. PtaU1.Bin125]|nr:MAG: hypothetical protein A4E28_01090 [Methanocella sp. PtaU1.Bin125]